MIEAGWDVGTEESWSQGGCSEYIIGIEEEAFLDKKHHHSINGRNVWDE